METKHEVKMIEVDFLCPKCEKGNLRPNGNVSWLSDPPQFPHKCNSCDYEQTFTVKYPTLSYVIV